MRVMWGSCGKTVVEMWWRNVVYLSRRPFRERTMWMGWGFGVDGGGCSGMVCFEGCFGVFLVVFGCLKGV